MAPPPAYRVIYNWDGAPHGDGAPPQSMERFLEATFAPLKDTHVDALFFSCGGHTAQYPSEVLPLVRDRSGRLYESVGAMIGGENVLQMIERGEDYQAAMIERGHELGIDVFASFRVNDNHFDGALTPQDAAAQDDMTPMRLEHPEWTLGTETAPWFATSWNMSVPEVREHIYEAVVELCERADWDGLEMDWQRHAFHLPQDKAHTLRAYLTDLQRAVRLATQRIAAQRGRPFLLAVRVSASLQACANTGYDVEQWLDEGLCDILIPGANAETDPSIDVREWQALCRPHGVPVYPGFDASLPNASQWQGGCVGPEPMEEKNVLTTTAIASRYHHHGADGIYCFNWHSNGSDYRRDMLEVIGEPTALAQADKIYAATHRVVVEEGFFAGAYRVDRLKGELPVPLLPTLSGVGPVVTLELAPEAAATGVKLRLRMSEWTPEDAIALRWDDKELPAPEEVVSAQIGAPHYVGDVPMGDVWLWWSLELGQCGAGVHSLSATLVERHPLLAAPITLTDVELVVSCTEGRSRL